jgi:hypothetical protein
MREREWMAVVLSLIAPPLREADSTLQVRQGATLPYACEILELSETAETRTHTNVRGYQTDLLVIEVVKKERWKPRLVIEGKLGGITTHGAITYSEKAATHKQVFPFLRYGILMGHRKDYPLPGRLFRHGLYFDFMLSWRAHKPAGYELQALLDLVLSEVAASRKMEELLYENRDPNRTRYYMLHRPLRLAEFPDDTADSA